MYTAMLGLNIVTLRSPISPVINQYRSKSLRERRLTKQLRQTSVFQKADGYVHPAIITIFLEDRNVTDVVKESRMMIAKVSHSISYVRK